MIDLQKMVPQAEEAVALDWYQDEDGYTEIGNAVHDIKYSYLNNYFSCPENEKLNYLIDMLVDQLLPFVSDCDVILPIPSFNPRHKNNPTGDLKIIYMIATRLVKLAKYSANFALIVLEKTSLIKQNFTDSCHFDFKSKIISQDRVLLIDDLFGKGTTAKYCIDALKNNNPNIFVRFISLTKNKFGGIHKKITCTILSDGRPTNAKNKKEFIILHFKFNDIDNKVWIWEDNSRCQR
ncbi:MAG: phosphoribosyltransferase [Streptococcus sp.]